MSPKRKQQANVADELDSRPRCASCGHPATDRRNFCGSCGAALPSLKSVLLDRASLKGHR